MILQLSHTSFIKQSLKEIHSGRETGLIDTGPLSSTLYALCIEIKNIFLNWNKGKTTLIIFLLAE